MKSNDFEVRCSCRRQPLLAVCGKDSNGNGYVHVKAVKGGKSYTEVVIVLGEAHIRCRECLRWHKVTVIYSSIDSIQQKLPAHIEDIVNPDD